jgi:hypothetical protein
MEKTSYALRYLVLIAALAGFLPFFAAAHGGDFRNDPQSLMVTYFDALKSGDVDMVTTLLTDPILSSKRLLLEKNTAYPEYLRDYYKGSGMTVTDIGRADEGDTREVTVQILFEGDENPLLLRFLLKFTDEGWKIAEESSAP